MTNDNVFVLQSEHGGSFAVFTRLSDILPSLTRTYLAEGFKDVGVTFESQLAEDENGVEFDPEDFYIFTVQYRMTKKKGLFEDSFEVWKVQLFDKQVTLSLTSLQERHPDAPPEENSGMLIGLTAAIASVVSKKKPQS